jgi:hypothetical protein
MFAIKIEKGHRYNTRLNPIGLRLEKGNLFTSTLVKTVIVPLNVPLNLLIEDLDKKRGAPVWGDVIIAFHETVNHKPSEIETDTVNFHIKKLYLPFGGRIIGDISKIELEFELKYVQPGEQTSFLSIVGYSGNKEINRQLAVKFVRAHNPSNYQIKYINGYGAIYPYPGERCSICYCFHSPSSIENSSGGEETSGGEESDSLSESIIPMASPPEYMREEDDIVFANKNKGPKKGAEVRKVRHFYSIQRVRFDVTDNKKIMKFSGESEMHKRGKYLINCQMLNN